MKKDFSILIGGAAGLGSRKAGLMIAKLLAEYGYRIFIYDDYQSLIRGGHSYSKIRAAEKNVLSHREKIDFLLALDKKTIDLHQKELEENGLIICTQEECSPSFEEVISLPAEKIIQNNGGKKIMKNIVLVAAFAKVTGIKWQTLKKVLEKEIAKKYIGINIKIAKESFERVEQRFVLEKLKQKKVSLLTGNEAVGLGAIKAGLKAYFAYPMTPATGILHYLANQKKKFNLKVVQLENEVGIINAALGAAYTGARTMVGTSGGGFALMVEGFSLAAQSEIPIVVVESQRMSPASGVPTYQGQGDLLFVLGAGHGDIVRFVIAPGDAEEACFWAAKILNLAWKYQTPSILLIDKEISESTFSFDEKILKKIKVEKPLLWDRKGDYLRYKITKNGISPLAFPGERGVVVKANSYEHDEFGITVEEKEKVVRMQEKRLRKFKEMKKEVEKIKEAVKVYGQKNSEIAIIVWGSTKGPAKEAAEKLGIKMIQPLILQPFPEKQIKKALKNVESLILVETNGLGQLEKVLNSYGIKVSRKILKYDGRPFTAEEIEKEIKKNFKK